MRQCASVGVLHICVKDLMSISSLGVVIRMVQLFSRKRVDVYCQFTAFEMVSGLCLICVKSLYVGGNLHCVFSVCYRERCMLLLVIYFVFLCNVTSLKYVIICSPPGVN